MTDISDELIRKAAQGDMAAFEKIYKATSGFVYNVVLRIASNRSDADEITQDVFVKVHKSLDRFGFRSSFKTWVYRIAANTAINHCKKAARQDQGKVEYDPAVHDIAIPGDAMAQFDDQKLAAQKVTSLLQVLDPDQRACIVLREMEELDYKTIADTLQINLNTVRSRLKRARQKLIAEGRKE